MARSFESARRVRTEKGDLFTVAANVVWAAIVIVTAVVAYRVGSAAGHQAKLNSKIVSDLRNDRLAADTQLRQTMVSINSNKARLAKLEGYEHRMIALRNQIAGLYAQQGIIVSQRQLADARSPKTPVNAQLGRKAGPNSPVITAIAFPVQKLAGHYTVGRDIAAGRYTVTSDGNFVVRDAGGQIKVDVILGSGNVVIERYMCELRQGDTIDATGSVRLYLIG